MNPYLIAIPVMARIPVFLWGPPGIGKTERVAQVAEAMRRTLVTRIVSLYDPTEFTGLTHIPPGAEETKKFVPEWAVKLNKEPKGIVFLDELSTAVPSLQGALLRLILEGAMEDFKFHPGVSFVAAGNASSHATGVYDLTPQMANRFCHIEMVASIKEWEEWVMGISTVSIIPELSENWTAHIPKHKALILSFLKTRPSLLHKLPVVKNGMVASSQAGKAWESPRSWTMAATLAAVVESIDNKEARDAETALFEGCVTAGAAQEYFQWKLNLDLPDPDDLLNDPDSFMLPKRPDQQLTILTSVISRAVQFLSKENWEAAWRIMKLTIDAGRPDLAAAVVRPLAIAESKLTIKLPRTADILAVGPVLGKLKG